MAPKKPVKNPYDRKCVYIGRRLGKTKVLQVFLLLPEKTEMCFSGVKGVYIGYTYECTAESISRRPKQLDDERIEDAKWEAEDGLVDVANAKKRAEKKFADESKAYTRRAVEALRPLVKGLTTWEREALIKHLAEKARH